MESFEEPSQIRRNNLLEVPALNDSLSEDEDIEGTLKRHFSPLPRRRNSASSEDMEPEPPSAIARKVSFADAFGFNLVSVKEFNTWDVPITSQNDDLEVKVLTEEEYFLSPLFILPGSQEELLQKVRVQKVLLESIEFLPGITCMKGIIRVLNVSFEKLIYVRMSLDDWLTYYDILAEYVPNSCDGETDQFFFKISLVPPYQRNGAKVEFCIRYETSVGTFWANNDDKNYILLCHKKETVQEVDDASHEEATDKYIKGCLKTSLSSKEEILALSDEDIWNNSRTSEANIPQIVYSHEKDKDIELRHENEKDINVECSEDNKEDNEKELELLLSQQFPRTRSTSSRDERNLYTTEPVNFPNEAQGLENKLTLMETGTDLLRQPVPISSPSENTLEEVGEELHDNNKYSIRYDYSQPLAEELTAGIVNNSKQPLECIGTSETLLSQEYLPGTMQNVTIHIKDTVLSRQGMSHVDISKGETDSASGSEMMERLFISGDDADIYKEACEMRPETISSEHDESMQLNTCVTEALDDNANPAPERHILQTSHLKLASVLPDSDKYEEKGGMILSKDQVQLRGDIYAEAFAHSDISTDCSKSPYTEKEVVVKVSKKDYNTDIGKEEEEIKLNELGLTKEQESVDTIAPKLFSVQGKYITDTKTTTLPSASDNKHEAKPSQAEDQMISHVADERRAEDTHEFKEFTWLKDRGSSDNRSRGKEITSSVEGKQGKEEYSELSDNLGKTDSRYTDTTQSKMTTFPSCYPVFAVATGKARAISIMSLNPEDTLDTKENDHKLFEERMYSQDNFPTNKNILETDACQLQIEKSDSMVTDDQSRVVCENRSVSGSQTVERESEINRTEQIKDGEIMFGMRNKTRYLNVTPTEELFTCQETVRCEKSSVAEHGNTEEAEAGTAYIIKTTSESVSEKMSASEKAVIAKLPQEIAVSDRPTEEKETAFDTHEGRNDGSHYTLCQRNTVGVLYDTEFEKESVLDIYNAHVRETLQGEMMSVCNTKEKVSKAEHDIGNNPPVEKTLRASAIEGKAGLEQDLYSEESLKAPPNLEQRLYSDEAEEHKEKTILGTLFHSGAKGETKPPPSDTNIVPSCHYESSPATTSEESIEVVTAEVENTEHPYTAPAFNSIANISAESGYYFNLPSEISCINKNMLTSSDERERNIGQCFHQTEFRQEESLGPMILISEPTEEIEETSSKSEGLITEGKILNWPDDSEHENQHISDSSDISDQKSEANSLPSESLVLKHISYRIFYFLLFVVFVVTIYHYDIMVCVALYLFSLYWLYWEGGRHKESVKKE
ncbi:protein phosphatase 1 regulatory subunit 3A isoform X1 [Gopherus evgoodei]|uniref:protein phosphatase 1 regulatory subunit 3A isoform X1 n=1 Tax=Gopherus evgoodei TaxID=1825980 RepID=UPI0011CEF1F6|nr:protein phosphatase 1 regulatory subunit 3A isoform X1 [Gopherus evgoodei]